MKISVITVVYNNSLHIKDCLNSISSQTYSDIEHIVIDGNSSDGTQQIISGFKDKIAIYKSEPDKGMYDALNKGLALATGDVIGVLHSDDIFAHNQVIERIAEKLASSGADVLYGDLTYVDARDPEKIIRYWKSCGFEPRMLRKGWMPPHPTLFIKRELVLKTGFFDLSFKIAADYDYMLRVLQTPGITLAYLDEIITKMRVGGKSNRSFSNIVRKSYEDYKILKKNKTGGLLSLLLKNTSKVKQFFAEVQKS